MVALLPVSCGRHAETAVPLALPRDAIQRRVDLLFPIVSHEIHGFLVFHDPHVRARDPFLRIEFVVTDFPDDGLPIEGLFDATASLDYDRERAALVLGGQMFVEGTMHFADDPQRSGAMGLWVGDKVRSELHGHPVHELTSKELDLVPADYELYPHHFQPTGGVLRFGEEAAVDAAMTADN